MPKYGYSVKEINKLEKDGILYSYGQVLCLACYQKNKEKATTDMYFGSICTTHLKAKHHNEFNCKHPVEHYRKLYPGTKIMGKETLDSIFEKNPNEKYQDISLNKIKKDITGAGGLGVYSQNQLLLIQKKLLALADIYEKEKDYDAMISTLKIAAKVVSDTSPPRSGIDTPEQPKRATKKDNAALDKLDELIGFIEVDVKHIKNKDVSQKVKDGWTNPSNK